MNFKLSINSRAIAVLLLLLLPAITACDSATVRTIANAAIRGDLSNAASQIARNKASYYANNPMGVVADYKQIKKQFLQFIQLVEAIWGPEDVQRPSAKRYVKYTHNYKSRALVDFDKGTVLVETLDDENPKKSLQEAIVTTLLTPEDPGAVDLYSAKPIALTGKPYLQDQVLDQHKMAITTINQAQAFAGYLQDNRLQKAQATTPKGKLTRYFVKISMVKDHLNIRAARYKSLVKKYATKYGVSPNLIFSIIKTESDFNPFAVSSAPAYGLMQIVPTTAGRDTYNYIHGRNGTPSRDYLFDASNNIRMGTAYLDLLGSRHLGGITNQVSREYCMIAAYNGGIGRLLRIYSKNRKKAIAIINSKKPGQIYATLSNKMPAESQRYLMKVVDFKRGFVGI